MRGRPAKLKKVFCNNCDGILENWSGRIPHGWYQLTASVPANVDERGYVWVGIYCSATCLAEAGPEIARLEELAQLAYRSERPKYMQGSGVQ